MLFYNDSKMKRIFLRKKIRLLPNQLNSNLTQELHSKLESVYNGTCSEDGYVLSIFPDICIIDNKITSNGSALFDVKFEAQNLKPEIGNVFSGIICLAFEGGLLVEVEKRMNVLIPSTQLPNMEFKKGSDSFVKTVAPFSSLKINDTVSVVIDQIRYDNCKFNCIGHLKNGKVTNK